MTSLVLLRHGESAWNADDRFTGWVDVPLTASGEEQARHSGRLLAVAGLLPDVVHTSVLSRAVRTATVLLDEVQRPDVAVRQDWRLNERCYGALQGQDRTSVRRQYGEQQYRRWRRSYDEAPPPVERGSRWDTSDDPRYLAAGVPVPRTESLADVVARLLPCWYGAVVPDLRSGATVLVVAHSNSLRALVAHLDGLGAQEVLGLDIPTGMPLRYDLVVRRDETLVPLRRGGEYLEPAAARAAAQVVAELGSEPDRTAPTDGTL